MTTISISSELHVAAAKPATDDQAGYEALTFTEVEGVVNIGEFGDNSEDVTATRLKDGRTEHFNGAKDGGEIQVQAISNASDPGQIIVKAGSGTNTTHSFKIVDPNGNATYFFGRLANWTQSERTASSYEGVAFTMRRNSDAVEVAA